MRCEEETYTSSVGHSIFRRHFIPQRSGQDDVTGVAVFVHGLGDHSGRHTQAIEKFVRKGIYCVAPDLPGHGHTEGTRGFIQSIETVHTIIKENLEHVRTEIQPNAPVGLLGHSMGGFFALHYLAEFPSCFNFSWISSPLIDASWRRSRLLQTAAQVLGVIYPKFTIHSNVPSSACSRDPQRLLETQKDPLKHKKLTMRLGKMLLNETARLEGMIQNIDPELRILVTHGSQDAICPSALSQELFQQLPEENARYALFEGMLHEPFNDIGSDAFFQELQLWLDELTVVSKK